MTIENVIARLEKVRPERVRLEAAKPDISNCEILKLGGNKRIGNPPSGMDLLMTVLPLGKIEFSKIGR